MKKITLLCLLALAPISVFAQNLITNGTFDDASGWTIVNHKEATNTLGMVAISGGVATFSETAINNKDMGIYTSVTLEAGKTYLFDMEIDIDGIVSSWGDVYIGQDEPVQNANYGDSSNHTRLMQAYNTWQCPSLTTYSGLASESGCSFTEPIPFTVPAGQGGTWYLVFKTGVSDGGGTYGPNGIVVDNMTLKEVPENLVTNGAFNDASGWTVVNHAPATNTLGAVAISGGVATFTETALDFKHMGIYTSVTLEAGKTYEFDMNVNYDGIVDTWGEVWIGQNQPNQNADYGTDQGATKLMRAFNSWDCPTLLTYNGLASKGGCPETTPSVFTVPAGQGGTYYLLFRAGATNANGTYGSGGIVVDNMKLNEVANLSVSSVEISDFRIYPNPAIEAWTVSSKNQVIKSIEVFNMIGEKVINLQPRTLSAVIDASSLTSGIYITQITTEAGAISKKLIKD